MSIVMGMQTFIKTYQKVQEIGPVSLFSEFEPWQNLDQSQLSFDNLIGYILSISMCMQNFITIFFTVQEMGPFSLFQNLELGKASTDKKCQFAISWARSYQYQCLRKSLSKYSTQFKRLSAKFYQNIPNGLRVKFHFFSECEPRQNLDQYQMSFDNLMGYILSIPMCMQNFISIFHSVQEIGPFSLFQNLELSKTSTNEK